MSNWHTEDPPTATGPGAGALLFGVIAAIVGILLIGIFIIRPISEASADREQSRAYAAAAQSQAQIAAERERSERTAQEQITLRAAQERRAEVTVYGIVLLAAILGFGLVIAASVGLVYGIERITMLAADRRAVDQEKYHQRLLILAAQVHTYGLESTGATLTLPTGRPSPILISEHTA